MLITTEFLDVPVDTDQFNRGGPQNEEAVLIGGSIPIRIPAGVFCGDEPPPIPPGVFHA